MSLYLAFHLAGAVSVTLLVDAGLNSNTYTSLQILSLCQLAEVKFVLYTQLNTVATIELTPRCAENPPHPRIPSPSPTAAYAPGSNADIQNVKVIYIYIYMTEQSLSFLSSPAVGDGGASPRLRTTPAAPSNPPTPPEVDPRPR